MEVLGGGPTAVDTVAFIYFIEENPRFIPVLRPLFEQVDGGDREIVTSAVTLLEVLVVPYRAGDLALADRYEALLVRGRGMRLVDPDRVQLRAAAQLRARHGSLRAPDALQLAAALSSGCTALITSDRRYPAVPGLRIVQLSDHV
jgi:predicted nucleic acid-binding protein